MALSRVTFLVSIPDSIYSRLVFMSTWHGH